MDRHILYRARSGVSGQFAELLPMYAWCLDTTQDGQADALWIDQLLDTDRRFLVLQETAQEVLDAPSLADLLNDLRDQVYFPAGDVAALCGVKRRQFYNLLAGASPNPQRDQHIRLVCKITTALSDAVGGDPIKVRAALLMPVSDDYRSLYDAAVAQDCDLGARAEQVITRLRSGNQRGLIPRPSPRTRRGGREALDFLTGYPDELPSERGD